jgi:hypothetical protein
MSLLPDKNLVLLTSALVPNNQGAVSPEERFKQTLDSIKSLRQHFPNDYIFFTDGSSNDIPQEWLQQLHDLKTLDAIAVWNFDSDIQALSSAGKKSETEIVLLVKTLTALLQNPDLQKMMYSVKRIYKFSARTVLHEDFDPKEHDHYGKYVFKKRIHSWLMPTKQAVTTDHLFITRMYSLCPSLITDYCHTLIKCFETVNSYGIDTEHAHHQHIDKKYLVELEKLHCEGIVAGSGATETY